MIARIGRLFTTVARHGVPLGGVFGLDWHPASAIGVYWFESVLLVLATVGLCALYQRQSSPAAIAKARLAGDDEGVRVLEAQRAEISGAGIDPGTVLWFHLGSLIVFGVFFGGIMLIMIANGHIDEPMRWGELRDGAEAMLLVVVVGFTLDLWGFHRVTAASLRARVDACLVRWTLFWMLGFFGSWIIAITGRAAIFFGFFGALKITFESWATLARLFGWRSMNDRATPSVTRISEPADLK